MDFAQTLRMITNMLLIFYKCLAEFEIVIYDTFDFLSSFGLRFFLLRDGLAYNSETTSWILLKL